MRGSDLRHLVCWLHQKQGLKAEGVFGLLTALTGNSTSTIAFPPAVGYPRLQEPKGSAINHHSNSHLGNLSYLSLV